VIRGGTELSGVVQGTGKNPAKQFLKKMIGPYLWRSLKDAKLIRFDKHSQQLLETEVQKFLPDLIYERAGFMFSSGAEVADKYKIKYITEVNAPFEEEVRSFEGAGSFYEGSGRKKFIQVMHQANLVCTVSSALKDFLAKTYSINSGKILVTPNAISPDAIKMNVELQHQIKEKISNGKKVIGFVGSIFPYHGVDLLISAFARINRERNDCLLLIVGDGYLIPELKNLAQDSGCANEVVFTGSVKHTDVFSYIDAMDIAVMAKSNWYGSPVKIFEYGALNKPIIAPDTIPVRDVMENEKDGLLIQPTEDAIHSALKRLLNDPGFAESVAASFRNKVLGNYTWKKVAENILLNCK
jgi:glycosyltransferase involved in cell wall biosynthesis